MDRGIIILAQNNEELNYVKQASVIGHVAKYFLNVPLTVIAPKEEIEKLSSKEQNVFDKIINVDTSIVASKKWYNTSKQDRVELSYFNALRPMAYELSPYEETIMIDTDYLMQNSLLANVWGSTSPILMNSDAYNINLNQPIPSGDKRLNLVGPKMYWATCMYFRKSLEAELLFNMVKHIQENYSFYKTTYGLPSTLYRNDYAFTIAAHLINNSKDDWIASLPVPMLNSYFTDELLDVQNGSVLIESGIPVRISGQNVHIMNKFSLEKQLDKILKVY